MSYVSCKLCIFTGLIFPSQGSNSIENLCTLGGKNLKLTGTGRLFVMMKSSVYTVSIVQAVSAGAKWNLDLESSMPKSWSVSEYSLQGMFVRYQ